METSSADGSWPFGQNEMARRIRGHDWSATPLGAIGFWPQSLRTAVDMVLAMPGPATILWGPRNVQIYNDAYVHIARGRHPFLLGQAVADGWPDAYDDTILPLLTRSQAGHATRLKGFAVALDGADGCAEKRWFDTDWSPIRDENGTVAGTLQTLVETFDRVEAQNAMRESEARHRLLIGSWAQAVWETDADGVVVSDSPSWRAYTGQTLEEWLGYGWLDAIHPDDRAFAKRQWREAIGRRGLVDVEFRLRAPGGNWRWTNVRAAPVVDAQGRIAKWAGMNIDIDARKEAEAALRRSEERFRSFAEHSTDALWIVDAHTRRLVYLSPAFERIWGVERENEVADLARWAEAVHPEDREDVFEALPRAAAGGSIQITYRIRRADDGRVRWIRDTGFPIRNAQGEIGHVGGISQDVTELHRTELRLRTIVEGIPQLVWRSDEGGDWTWASPQWTEHTGQTQEESRGRGWLDALHPEDRDTADAVWREAGDAAYPQMETRIFDVSQGRYRWFQTRALPVRERDGRIVEWLGTSTDIDDLRRLREHQNVLVAELQHRTRNLLGVVRSLADRTAAGTVSLGTFMVSFRERLGALSRINGLLSMLEKGERVTFDALLHAELEAHGLFEGSIAARVVLDGPRNVRLRSATIQTFALAIHELTTNAVKYGAFSNGAGRLAVRWRIARVGGGGDELQLEWLESGVRDMAEPGAAPRGGGNGRLLIERALPYQLGARTTYELRADGVRCTIDLPLR